MASGTKLAAVGEPHTPSGHLADLGTEDKIYPASAKCTGGVLARLGIEPGEHPDLGVDQAHPGGEIVEQPRSHVHLAHEVTHLRQRVVRGLDDDVDAVTENRELCVGDECGDLDKGIVFDVEARHLAVDPDEPASGVSHGAPLYRRATDASVTCHTGHPPAEPLARPSAFCQLRAQKCLQNVTLRR